MKRTISRLLQINPIPISSLKSKQVEIRLPPTSSSSSSLSSATSSSSSNSPIATASKANKLSTPVLDNLFEHQRKCIEAESTGQNQEGMVWPRNLRLERQVNKRELYWKVPKEQRDFLRKSLKEA